MVVPGVIPAIVEGCTLFYRAVIGSERAEDCCRSCTIEIRNHNKRLEFRQPEYYLHSGVSRVPPEPVISPSSVACCSFRKTYNSPYGTSGVITYDIVYLSEPEDVPCHSQDVHQHDHHQMTVEKDTESKSEEHAEDHASLVLMWSVPMIGTTYHALGVERAPFASKDAVFQKLYYGEDKWFNRDVSGMCVKYEDVVHGVPVAVFGSISDAGHATWTIDIE